MALFFSLIFILLIKNCLLQAAVQISLANDINNYFQPTDNFSFNLKDYREIRSFYSNFHRKGDIVAYKHSIKLAPKINNTYGLFYTEVININYKYIYTIQTITY